MKTLTPEDRLAEAVRTLHPDGRAAWAKWRSSNSSELTDNDLLKALWSRIAKEGCGDGFWDIDPLKPDTFLL